MRKNMTGGSKDTFTYVLPQNWGLGFTPIHTGGEISIDSIYDFLGYISNVSIFETEEEAESYMSNSNPIVNDYIIWKDTNDPVFTLKKKKKKRKNDGSFDHTTLLDRYNRNIWIGRKVKYITPEIAAVLLKKYVKNLNKLPFDYDTILFRYSYGSSVEKGDTITQIEYPQDEGPSINWIQTYNKEDIFNYLQRLQKNEVTPRPRIIKLTVQQKVRRAQGSTVHPDLGPPIIHGAAGALKHAWMCIKDACGWVGVGLAGAT